MKQLLYYFFACALIFSLIGCSSNTSKTSTTNNTKETKTEMMVLKDNEIDNIKLLKSQNNNSITTNTQTSNENLIKEIVMAIKDGSPTKVDLDEKSKKSTKTNMEVNFKNGSEETLLILNNDTNEVSIVDESGKGYKLKKDTSKLVLDFLKK